MTASFGDVTGEYLALRRGAGIITGEHELVWVVGPDAVTFLDGLLSQSIASIPQGAAARSLLLAPQGKLRATLWVLRAENRVGLVADRGRAETVVGDLSRFKLRVDAELSVDERAVCDLWGPGAADALAGAGMPVPDRASWLESGGVLVAALPFVDARLPRYVAAGADIDSLTGSGAVEVGALAARAVRIEAGEPVTGIDIDDGTIPQEGGVVEGAVDFGKGCYLGQELVARIDSRGHVNRLLRGVLVSENILPPSGAEVVLGDRVVGSLSSVAESLELRAPVALGLLRREAEPGTEVEIRWKGGSTVARVAELPLDPTL